MTIQMEAVELYISVLLRVKLFKIVQTSESAVDADEILREEVGFPMNPGQQRLDVGVKARGLTFNLLSYFFFLSPREQHTTNRDKVVK